MLQRLENLAIWAVCFYGCIWFWELVLKAMWRSQPWLMK